MRLTIQEVAIVRERTATGARIQDSEDAAAILNPWIGNADREHFVTLHLDIKHRVIARETVSIGTLNSTHAHPREVFKGALMNNAYAIIVAHNHPSGDLTPSPDDIALTDRLRSAGKLLGVPVLDHVIVTGDGFHSLRLGCENWD